MKEGEKWVRQSAEQGHHKAQYAMGILYQHGLGVKKNNTDAYMWFELAAQQSHVGAQQARDKLAKTMKPKEIASAKLAAREWNEKFAAR